MEAGSFDRLRSAAQAACEGRGPAHDFAHVLRVARLSEEIAGEEGADRHLVLAAALLHELFNYPKDHTESPRSGVRCAELARALLLREGWKSERADRVAYAIRVHPFSLGVVPETLEARILQDADRLDAIGAIGIARCFATGAEMKRPFYATDDPFCMQRAPDDKRFTLDHFYRKLLRVKDSLHTEAARRVAAKRTTFMRAFLDQFAEEI